MATRKTSNPQTALPIDAIGHVTDRSIVQEVQESYLDYAMSVIISRALPDARDGLKPVHRRTLYAMWGIGLKPGGKFRKSATVVGEVLGKYHPHGDQAVYDTMVRMAQDFSMRYPLVWGQGNFGSLDGDSPAAMRYTEAKLAPISEEIMQGIEKDTVDFVPNYDGSYREPTVMPAKLPNLLLNGTVGIAVGMATNIPPHNLTELCDAVVCLIGNPDATVEDLMEFVKGPDFPTGGIIYGQKDILQALSTGKGGIVMRAKTEIVESASGKFSIIVHEIPYQVNKATLIEKVAQLVQDKKLDGIRDIRDESNKEGVRIVIELKKDAYPKKVLNRLFLMTPLQETFHVNMLALVDGIQPRILNLKSSLEQYIGHRKEVVRRRTEYDLARAEERAHILRGLKVALDNLDAVIKTIRASQDRDDARKNLIAKFRLDEIQANAILEMRLQQLANMERQKVEDELKEKESVIKGLKEILASAKRIMSLIREEVLEIRDRYGDERRTEVRPHGVKEFAAEDLIPNEAAVILITDDGYIKRLPPDTFRTQIRGGKGVSGVKTKDEDSVREVFATNTHANLYFFTSRGRVFRMKAFDVPQTQRTAKGQALVNFLQLAPNETVSAVFSGEDIGKDSFMVMATRKGVIKKTPIADFANVRSNGLIAISLRPEDSLQWVRLTGGQDEVVMATAKGQSIRFRESDVRPMGRNASGVRAVALRAGDEVVGMDTVAPEVAASGKYDLMIIMANGFGKRTGLLEYKVQGRGGSGLRTAHITEKTGRIVEAMIVSADEDRDLLVMSAKGQVIRLESKSVPTIGRDTQGVRIMRFKEEKDTVASATLV